MTTETAGDHQVPDFVRAPANYINGQWENREEKTFEARNPASGERLALLPESSRETAQRAIAAAGAAQGPWFRVSQWERADACERIGRAIAARTQDLARLLSLEQGKPLAEAVAEVKSASHCFSMAGEQVRYMTGEILSGVSKGRQVLARRFPRGVYAVITPWNYPVNIPAEYIAPGIATGNSVVWVPAPTTSLVSIALMQIIDEAGIPPGLVNLVLGAGATIGDEIVGHPGTHAIGFTGSTRTGELIARRGAGKPMVLELGGNGPMIVRRDADIEKAALAATVGSFTNCGQVCSSTGRVLADREIAGALSRRIAELAEERIVGNPLHQGTTMGSLNNAAVARKVREHVEDAIASGADRLAGGVVLPHLGSDLFFAPTVLANVTPDMRVAREETFGPVVPVIPLPGDDALLHVARQGEYGLSMAIFSQDIETAIAMSGELSAGVININETTILWETHMPFGGSSGSASGSGRVGGHYAIDAMTEVRTLSIPTPDYPTGRRFS